MKLFQYVILSVFTHVLIYSFLSFLPAPPPSLSTQTIDILYLDKKESDAQKKQFVTAPDEQKKLIDKLKQLEQKAKFLSREVRRVEKEQVAAQSGLTKNSIPSKNRYEREPTDDMKPQNEPTQRPPLTGPGTLATRAKNELIERNARLSESTISEYIPEVKVGGFTSLNTDQFLFYTFYARINEQLRSRWVQNLRNFMQTGSPVLIERLAREPQITEVEVVLDANGRYLKSIIHRNAGDRFLDDSAIQAFVQAAPFNNPPSEIVGPDGNIRLHYAFYVELRPRYMANGSK
jgi:TonB family protein